jgi:hypothetical protein
LKLDFLDWSKYPFFHPLKNLSAVQRFSFTQKVSPRVPASSILFCKSMFSHTPFNSCIFKRFRLASFRQLNEELAHRKNPQNEGPVIFDQDFLPLDRGPCSVLSAMPAETTFHKKVFTPYPLFFSSLVWERCRWVLGTVLLYCDVESKWKNYHIITFPG